MEQYESSVADDFQIQVCRHENLKLEHIADSDRAFYKCVNCKRNFSADLKPFGITISVKTKPNTHPEDGGPIEIAWEGPK